MKKKTLGYLLQIIVLLGLIATGIWRHQHRTYQVVQQGFVMDTLFEIELESSIEDMSGILDSCFTIAKECEIRFSAYTDSGAVHRLNEFAGKGVLKIDNEVADLIVKSGYYYKKTGGSYDITIGRLADLWDIENKRIPEEEEIARALRVTGYDKLVLNGNIFSMPEGMKINLGSIAKGYTVDRIRAYLETRGIANYIVNAGGDLYIKSDKSEVIGIQHPRLERGTVIDKLCVQEGAIVTSGDYERFFEIDGKRYHHIIDAKSGYPAKTCVAVTAICEDAETADVLSTSAFLLEPKEAVRLADGIENAAVIVYYLDEEGKLSKMKNERAKKYLEGYNG